MREDESLSLTPRRRLIAAISAAAIVVVILGAFAWPLHPATQERAASASPPAPAMIRASDVKPAASEAPRLLESGAPFSFADLVERVAPAVVTVTVKQKLKTPQMNAEDVPEPFRDFFKQFGMPRIQPQGRAVAMGSGFIIDKAGYIVTNNHVVEDGSKITVKLKDGREYTAKLIGTDSATDVALLKIDAGKPLPAAEFANDRRIRVGDWVIAVGNPFGLSNTVTAGIVSSMGRDVGNGPYTDYIQIDAPINRGNSGGPTFDIQGRVIGMNTMIYSPSGGSVGIGFAIPASTIHDVVAELKAHGKVARGWLGVEIQNLTPEMAASLGAKEMKGAIVATVMPDSPAAKAGFRQGDIVLAINGQTVADNRDLTRRVAAVPANSDASFAILRGGKKETLTARIGARNEEKLASASGPSNKNGPASTAKAMGLGLAAVTPELRHAYNLDDKVDGVVITKVDPDSDAADKGIQPGDVVMSVGNQAVHTPGEVKSRVAAAVAAGRDSVLLLLSGQDGERFLAIKIGKT